MFTSVAETAALPDCRPTVAGPAVVVPKSAPVPTRLRVTVTGGVVKVPLPVKTGWKEPVVPCRYWNVAEVYPAAAAACSWTEEEVCDWSAGEVIAAVPTSNE